jgi:hypothetical protein
VGILSRRRKRFLLNEHELVAATLALGYDVQLLPMEDMTLFEQISALRSCTVRRDVSVDFTNTSKRRPQLKLL